MTGCIVNIVLDPIMIFGIGPFPAMGIEGAALATGIGQTSAAVLYIIIYIVKPIPVKFRKSEMRIEGSMAKRPLFYRYAGKLKPSTSVYSYISA